MYRIFLCSSSITRRDDSDSACFGSRLSVTRFKYGARLQCVSLSRRCAARLHLYVWNERCRSLLTPSPRFVPIPVIARDASLARIEYLPSMLATARLRITDLSQTNPLSTLLHPTMHISPPGEKRRWRRRWSRNPIHQTQPLLLQVGRSVQLRLWGDCEGGRVVHPPACRAA